MICQVEDNVEEVIVDLAAAKGQSQPIIVIQKTLKSKTTKHLQHNLTLININSYCNIFFNIHI